MYIEFSHFDMEYLMDDDDSDGANSCSFDFLTIEERDDENNAISSKKYCNTMPKSFESSKALVIKYVHSTISFGAI